MLVMCAAVVGLPSKKFEPCSLPVTLKALIADVHPQTRVGRRDLVDREPSLRDILEMAAVLDLRALPAVRVPPVTKSTWSVSVGLMLWLSTPKPCVLTLAMALVAPGNLSPEAAWKRQWTN